MADSEPMDARLARIESRLDGMDRKIDVLTADGRILTGRVDELSQNLLGLTHRVDRLEQRMEVRFEHVDERFDRMAEAFDSLREHMDRRFGAMERRHDEQMALLTDVLTTTAGECAPSRRSST